MSEMAYIKNDRTHRCPEMAPADGVVFNAVLGWWMALQAEEGQDSEDGDTLGPEDTVGDNIMPIRYCPWCGTGLAP
jgi:hypothetical protein